MNSILVIIPVYNKESTVKRAIQSVLDQDYGNFTLLVIDDGSTDRSLAIIQEFKDDRIRNITQKNKGVSATRNRGINYAREHEFSWIAFLDGDDYWLPHHLSQLLELQKQFPQVQVLSSNYNIINAHGRTMTTQFSNLSEASTFLLNDFFSHQLLNTTINSSNHLITTNSFETIGLYNEKVTHGEDTEMLINMGIHLKSAFDINATVIIDKSAGNRSSGIQMHHRKLPNLKIYDQIEMASLQRFLNLQRFAIAMNYKRDGLVNKHYEILGEIDLDSLSKSQQRLLNSPKIMIQFLDLIKRVLQSQGWNLRLR